MLLVYVAHFRDFLPPRILHEISSSRGVPQFMQTISPLKIYTHIAVYLTSSLFPINKINTDNCMIYLSPPDSFEYSAHPLPMKE
jgi:hypothetical protein